MMKNRRHSLLSFPIDTYNLEESSLAIRDWALKNQKKSVICRDSRGIALSYEDQRFKQLHLNADMVTPDGMPLVWLLKLKGETGVERVCGPDLMDYVFKVTNNTRVKHFFYGSDENTVIKLINNLKSRYPNINISGYISPPFRSISASEESLFVSAINESKSNILWVGLGCPKQEFWLNDNFQKLDNMVVITVGAAFDWLAETVPRAPKFIQFTGLEWAFRFLLEPKRLARRNFIDNRKFVGIVLIKCKSKAIEKFKSKFIKKKNLRGYK